MCNYTILQNPPSIPLSICSTYCCSYQDVFTIHPALGAMGSSSQESGSHLKQILHVNVLPIEDVSVPMTLSILLSILIP